MGADIHMFMEFAIVPEDGEDPHWRSFGDRFNPGRNYTLFSLLAGVRGSTPPVIPPRGMPEDSGFYSAWANKIYISESAESDGFCTPEQAIGYERYGSEIHRDGSGKPIWVTHPDWHSHSWLSADELERVFEAYELETSHTLGIQYVAVLAALRALESKGANKARVVFWFDN